LNVRSGDKQLERIAHETIIETQEESEKDDEIIYKLLIDEKMVSWAKTTLYSHIDEFHTACLEKRKGYGRKLLAFMEKNAKAHGATSIVTCNFDPCNYAAISFFKKMSYTINQPKTVVSCSVYVAKLFK
jgi:ribosomal protein S18 acetylase RimI-like enzyme